jgi:hypothetical protein
VGTATGPMTYGGSFVDNSSLGVVRLVWGDEAQAASTPAYAGVGFVHGSR